MEVAKTLSLTRLQAGPSESSSHLAVPPQLLKSWTNTDIVSNSSRLPSLICLLEKTHGWQRICYLSQPAPETWLLSPPPASRRARWKHLCVAGQPPLPAFCNFPLPWFFGAPGHPILSLAAGFNVYRSTTLSSPLYVRAEPESFNYNMGLCALKYNAFLIYKCLLYSIQTSLTIHSTAWTENLQCLECVQLQPWDISVLFLRVSNWPTK